MKHLKDVYKEKTIPLFEKEHSASNIFAVPRLEKVVVNVGIGRMREDKEREEVEKALTLITGQRPEGRPARVAIASYKTRKGLIIGLRTTLRGKRMYDFLERMVFVAIPRMRDFRGISLSSIDEHGNLHVGIREHIIFPEMMGEDVRRIFSLQVTVVTNAKSRARAHALFESLGFPFTRDAEEGKKRSKGRKRVAKS